MSPYVKIYLLDSCDLWNVRWVLVYVSTCCWCSGLRVRWVGSSEPVLECQEPVALTILVWHLAAQGKPLGDSGRM